MRKRSPEKPKDEAPSTREVRVPVHGEFDVSGFLDLMRKGGKLEISRATGEATATVNVPGTGDEVDPVLPKN